MSYKCEICEKTFLNHRALNGHMSIHREKRYSISRQNKSTKIGKCLGCDEEIKITKSNNKKYCSNECFQLHRHEAFMKPKILDGNASISTIKKYLKENSDYICELCTSPPHHNGLPLTLQLDHIDGNSDNNDLDNLRWLCPNCHSQTETHSKSSRQNPKKTKRNKWLRLYKSGTSSIN